MFKLGCRTLILTLLTAFLALGLVLSGCGGGNGLSIGGGGGGVGKSPISGASVYARLADGSWTAVIGTTGSNGAITFTNLALIPSGDYPVVVKATGGTLNGGNGSAFTGELRGVLESATSNVYLSPASTLVATLIDQGVTLADAQSQIRAIVQNALGYTGVDPLGNFLISTAATQQNEIAQQALLFTLGITDAETNDNTMNTLLNTLQSTSTSLASGTTFSAIAQSESGFDGTTSLATFVNDNTATINQISADALGTTTSAMSVPTVDTTTEYPEKFIVNAVTADPGGNRSAVTANADTTSSFSADGNGGSTIFIKIGLTTASTSGGTWTAASDSQYTLNTIPSVGTFTQQDGTAVAVNDTFNAANANGATGVASVPVFKYVIASSTTAQTVTFKFTGSGVSGGSTVSRTITINIVNAATSVASSGLTWSGTSNIEELVDGSGTSTTLDAASTGSIGAADYVATVSILGGAGKTSNEVNAKYRISFLAPDGFAYNVSGTSWDNYDQATLSQTAGDTWTASVPTSVTLKTTAAKAFAAYNFTARLIDKDNGSTERTAGDSIYMVRNGATLWAAKIDNVKYTNTSGTTTATQLAVNGNNEVLFANPTTFTGRVLTWADIANSTTTGPASLTGTWYLIAGPAPSSGAYGFGASSLGTMTANYDASTVGVAAYAQPTITINMASKYFTPNYGANKSNQDTITLKFADTPNSFNVESNGGVTLTSTP